MFTLKTTRRTQRLEFLCRCWDIETHCAWRNLSVDEQQVFFCICAEEGVMPSCNGYAGKWFNMRQNYVNKYLVEDAPR